MSGLPEVIPPLKNSDAAPVICFDYVPLFGTTNGTILAELTTRVLVYGTDDSVLSEQVCTAHLRCSHDAALQLIEALCKAVQMIDQPAQDAAQAPGKLN